MMEFNIYNFFLLFIRMESLYPLGRLEDLSKTIDLATCCKDNTKETLGNSEWQSDPSLLCECTT